MQSPSKMTVAACLFCLLPTATPLAITQSIFRTASRGGAGPFMQVNGFAEQLDPRTRLAELDAQRESLTDGEYLERMRDIVQVSARELSAACDSGDDTACEAISVEDRARAQWQAKVPTGVVSPTGPPSEALRQQAEMARLRSELISISNALGSRPPEPANPTIREARIVLPLAALGTIGWLSLPRPTADVAPTPIPAGPVAEPITMAEVVAAQRQWGDALVRISQTYLADGDYVAEATKAADELYGYGRTNVLFKPTKASENPFRPTGEEALSYFVGGDNVPGGYAEDHGFALGPGGLGWKKVIFDNSQLDFNGATAQAMGEYYFYSAADDSVAKVEYTFGYKRNDDGQIRIYLHHSSLPYKPH